MTLALVYRPLRQVGYEPSSDFYVTGLLGDRRIGLGYHFSRSDFTRARPPQVELMGVRLELESTSADGMLRYRILATPPPGVLLAQDFPLLARRSPD